MLNDIKIISDEKLGIIHMKELNTLLTDLQNDASEYCFSNLYLFRNQHDYRVFRKDGLTFLQGITYDKEYFLMPFNKIDNSNLNVMKNLMKEGFFLFPLTEGDLSFFQGEEYLITSNPDDSDYVYTVERMKDLPGRNLHKKRNLVKQYKSLYNYENKDYTCEMKKDVLSVLNRWFEQTGLPVEDTDYQECREAINLCDIFDWTGQVYYANGEPSGILFGEKLNNNTFAVHFAKGITDYKGIYPHMYSSLAAKLEGSYRFLNFEQDMGKESLRQAKSSYLQDMMIKKYRVTLK